MFSGTCPVRIRPNAHGAVQVAEENERDIFFIQKKKKIVPKKRRMGQRSKNIFTRSPPINTHRRRTGTACRPAKRVIRVMRSHKTRSLTTYTLRTRYYSPRRYLRATRYYYSYYVTYVQYVPMRNAVDTACSTSSTTAMR